MHIETGAQHDMTPGDDGKLPAVASADDIFLVTAGGEGAGWSAYAPTWAPTIHARGHRAASGGRAPARLRPRRLPVPVVKR